MEPLQSHTRYRVQKLIRMGEWLERNEAAIVLAYDVLNEAHDKMIDPDETLNPNDLLDIVGHDQMQALMALRPMMTELRMASDWGAERDTDVTLHHPYACLKHKYEVVIEAPTKEESNETRSEVDV